MPGKDWPSTPGLSTESCYMAGTVLSTEGRSALSKRQSGSPAFTELIAKQRPSAAGQTIPGDACQLKGVRKSYTEDFDLVLGN